MRKLRIKFYGVMLLAILGSAMFQIYPYVGIVLCLICGWFAADIDRALVELEHLRRVR